MKKFLKLLKIGIAGLILIGIIAFSFGCNDTATTTAPSDGDDVKYVIRVTGTEGVEFTGSYMLVTWDGKSVSKSVDGTVPAEYSVDGSMVSTSFQKQSEGGTLKVEILKGDTVVAESETDAAYGVVTASSQ